MHFHWVLTAKFMVLPVCQLIMNISLHIAIFCIICSKDVEPESCWRFMLYFFRISFNISILYQQQSTICWQLKICWTINNKLSLEDWGHRGSRQVIISVRKMYKKKLSFKGFNLTKLNKEGFEGGIWDLFFAPNQDLVEIFRQDNISGKARFV